ILLQWLEPTRGPERRFSLFGPLCQPGTDGEHRWIESKKVVSGLPDERQYFLELGWLAEDVRLVDDDDDLLAPVTSRREKEPLGLGERTVGRRNEEDEVRPGHELGGEPLVFAHDGVGAGCVDDMDVPQQVDR